MVPSSTALEEISTGCALMARILAMISFMPLM